MDEIVGALLASHAPLVTGKPDIARPEQRERLHPGLRELGSRLAAARPDMLVMFVNDHLQNFPYSNMPAFCVGLAAAHASRRARVRQRAPRSGTRARLRPRVPHPPELPRAL